MSAPVPLEEDVKQLRQGLSFALQELDRVRSESQLENAKLQREFRETVDAILFLRNGTASAPPDAAAGSSNGADNLTFGGGSVRHLTKGGPMLSPSSPRRSYSAFSPADLRTTLGGSGGGVSLRDVTASAPTFPAPPPHHLNAFAAGNPLGTQSILDMASVVSRVDYLEQAIRGIVERRDAGPLAIDALLQQTSTFLRRAETDMSEHRSVMQTQVSVWATELETLRKQVAEAMTVPLRNSEDSLHRNVNDRVIEVASIVDAQFAQQADAITNVRQQIATLEKRQSAASEAFLQLDSDYRLSRDEAKKILDVCASKESQTAVQLEHLQRIIHDFTFQQSVQIRDEVVKLLESDTATTQRRVEERQRRDEIAAAKQDIIRALTTVDRVQEELSRVTTQQQSLYQAFQRGEQKTTAMQSKFDADLRSEFERLEQVQRSFFARQEQTNSTERHAAGLRLQEELLRVQTKQNDDVKIIEKRRLDDLAAFQEAYKKDLEGFFERQRREADQSATKLREEQQKTIRQTQEQCDRSLRSALDEAARTTASMIEEFRKSMTKWADDLRRVQSSQDLSSQRQQEQMTFLQHRTQQVMEEQVARMDRTIDDIALRLNAVVEDEVKRVISTHDASMQRLITQNDERLTRDMRTLKEDIGAVRQSLNVLSTPSGSLQSIDSRIDVLRRDVADLYDKVANTVGHDQRLLQESRHELRIAIESSRTELLREMGQSMHRVDGLLTEMWRDASTKGHELTMLAAKVDTLSMAVKDGSHPHLGGNAGGSSGGASGSLFFSNSAGTAQAATAAPNSYLQQSTADENSRAAARGSAALTPSSSSSLFGPLSGSAPPASTPISAPSANTQTALTPNKQRFSSSSATTPAPQRRSAVGMILPGGSNSAAVARGSSAPSSGNNMPWNQIAQAYQHQLSTAGSGGGTGGAANGGHAFGDVLAGVF